MSDHLVKLLKSTEPAPSDTGWINPRDPSLSSTLIHGLKVLECFRHTDDAFTNNQIAKALNLNKATVSRLCKTLMTQGYIRRDPKGGFRLAPGILSLSYPLFSAMKWRQQAVGLMTEFADFAKGNASLAVFNGPDTIYIQTAGDISNFPHVPEMGMTMPVARTATGRSLLSMLSQDELALKLREIERRYPRSIEEFADRIDESMESCKLKGYCVSFGEWRKNIYAISSPVGRTSDGLDVTISCGIPAYRARKEEVLNDLAPRLASVAENLRLFNIFGN
jgi:DNA-binding IclR family transcriptional regulator